MRVHTHVPMKNKNIKEFPMLQIYFKVYKMISSRFKTMTNKKHFINKLDVYESLASSGH